MRAFKIGILTAAAITIGTLSYFSKSDNTLIAANDCECSSGHLKINNEVQ